jgi:plastocyanin
MIEDKPRTDLPRAEQDQDEGPRFPPIAYPLLALVFAAILVWSFSRILLASPDISIEVGPIDVSLEGKYVAVVVAILMALNILVGSALVAYGRRVRRRPASFPLVMAGGLTVVAAGIVAFTFGDRPPGEAAGEPSGPPPITLTASGIKFLESKLTLPAHGQVTIDFQNQDDAVQHNFVLFDGPDANAPVLFDGPVITGASSTQYRFQAPPPGDYFFHCAIHPADMTGTATVPEGGQAGGGGGGPPGPAEVTARDVAFAPNDLSLPAEGQITIHFVNADDGVPHNISIFQGEDATGQRIFEGEIVTGPDEVDYTFEAPSSGSYFFHCDVHPTQMTGTIRFG